MANATDILSKSLRKLRQGVERGAEAGLREVAPVILRRIRDRTRRGISSTGRAFTPYARSTAKRKGRRAPVDLTDRSAAAKDGRQPMLDALYVDRRGADSKSAIRSMQRVRIALRGRKNQRLAQIHGQGRGRVPQRPWFGLSKQDTAFVRRTVGINVSREVQKVPRAMLRIVIR